MGWGHAPPTSWGLLLTCFSSAHSPHHGWHRSHCRPVHPVVLWRLLHVSFYRKPQDGGGGWGHCPGRCSWTGSRNATASPGTVLHSWRSAAPIPGLFRLRIGSTAVLEAKAHQGSALSGSWQEGGKCQHPQGSPLYPLLSAAPLASLGLSRGGLGPVVSTCPVAGWKAKAGIGKAGTGQAAPVDSCLVVPPLCGPSG